MSISAFVLPLALIGDDPNAFQHGMNFQDTVEAMREEAPWHTRDEMVAAFGEWGTFARLVELFDKNADGVVDIDELAQLELAADAGMTVLEAYTYANGAVREDGEMDTNFISTEHLQNWVVDATWNDMIEKYDEDGDTTISDDEWGVMVQGLAAASTTPVAVSVNTPSPTLAERLALDEDRAVDTTKEIEAVKAGLENEGQEALVAARAMLRHHKERRRPDLPVSVPADIVGRTISTISSEASSAAGVGSISVASTSSGVASVGSISVGSSVSTAATAMTAGTTITSEGGAAAAGGVVTYAASVAIPVAAALVIIWAFKYRSDITNAPYAYVGCWVDDNLRDLPVQTHNVWGDNMPANCSYHCRDYLFFGVQYGKECWCGNFFGTAPKYFQVADSECNNEFGKWKGGTWRNSIFTHHFKPVGCYVDDNSRDLSDKTAKKNILGHYDLTNPYYCALHCGKYPYFALQYGGECRCGHSYGTKPTYKKVDDRECQKNGGDDSPWLGGRWTNYVYDRRYFETKPFNGMELVGNGCCRFDSWKGSYQGYQTVKECNYRCLKKVGCVAADVARPKNGKYSCFLFNSSGMNFRTECGRKSTTSCYRRDRRSGTMKLFGNGCCRFDGWKGSHQGYQTVEECNARCLMRDGCMAADVASPKNGKYSCFLFYWSGANFRTECGRQPTAQCYRRGPRTSAMDQADFGL